MADKLHFERAVNQRHIIQLTSKLTGLRWGSRVGTVGEHVLLHVLTLFVGVGTTVSLTIKSDKGKTLSNLKDIPAHLNDTEVAIPIPDTDSQFITVTAILSSNGSKLDSPPLPVIPLRYIKDLKWQPEAAKREDIVKLQGKTHGIPNGERATMHVYRFIAATDATHALRLPVARIDGRVKDNQLLVAWQLNVHDLRDGVNPLHWQLGEQSVYQPYTLCFEVEHDGQRYGAFDAANDTIPPSGLLRYEQDTLTCHLLDNRLLCAQDVTITWADGSQTQATIEEDGELQAEGAPGPVVVCCEDLALLWSDGVDPRPQDAGLYDGHASCLPAKLKGYRYTPATNPNAARRHWLESYPLFYSQAQPELAAQLYDTIKLSGKQWQEGDYHYCYDPDSQRLVILFDRPEDEPTPQFAYQVTDQGLLVVLAPNHSGGEPYLGNVNGLVGDDGMVWLLLASRHKPEQHRWAVCRNQDGVTRWVMWTRTGKPVDSVGQGAAWWQWQIADWVPAAPLPVQPIQLTIQHEGTLLPNLAVQVAYLDDKGNRLNEPVDCVTDELGLIFLAEPLSNQLELTYPDLDAVHGKILASMAQAVLAPPDSEATTPPPLLRRQRLYRLLTLSPTQTQALIKEYEGDPRYGCQTSFVEDVKASELFTVDELLVLFHLNAVDTTLDVEPLRQIHPADSLRITADPGYLRLPPKTSVTYKIVHPAETDSIPIQYKWYVLYDPHPLWQNKVGPTMETGSAEATWAFESGTAHGRMKQRTNGWTQLGDHTIVCVVDDPCAAKPVLLRHQQTVAPSAVIGHKGLADISQDMTNQVDYMLNVMYRKVSELQDDVDKFKDALRKGGRLYRRQQQGKYARIREQLDTAIRRRDNLETLLTKSAAGRRYPIKAYYVGTGNSELQGEVKAFIYYKGQRKITRPRDPNHGKTYEHWGLTDWTDTANPDMYGNYEGHGETLEAGLRNLLTDWDRRNQYPTGTLGVKIPTLPEFKTAAIQQDIKTDGKTVLQEFANMLEIYSLGATALGLGLLLTPLAAGALMSLMLISAAATAMGSGVLRITDRDRRGVHSPGEDAMDIAMVVGGLLDLGIALRASAKLGTATVHGGWEELATVRDPGKLVSEGVSDWTLLGNAAHDSFSGVAIDAKTMAKIKPILEDTALSFEDRYVKLLEELTAANDKHGLLAANYKTGAGMHPATTMAIKNLARNMSKGQVTGRPVTITLQEQTVQRVIAKEGKAVAEVERVDSSLGRYREKVDKRFEDKKKDVPNKWIGGTSPKSPYLSEINDSPRIFGQQSLYGCGEACGGTLLKEYGVVFTKNESTSLVFKETGIPGEYLVDTFNKISNKHNLGHKWYGGPLSVRRDATNYLEHFTNVLKEKGSFIAGQGKHWVIVDDIDRVNEVVKIRDPWNSRNSVENFQKFDYGREATLKLKDFLNAWNNASVSTVWRID